MRYAPKEVWKQYEPISACNKKESKQMLRLFLSYLICTNIQNNTDYNSNKSDF
jgi:hypothetical protein